MENITVKSYEEYVNPDYVELTLSNGKKIKFEKKKIVGGTNAYQKLLMALDNMDSNPNIKKAVDALASKAYNSLKK